MHSADA